MAEWFTNIEPTVFTQVQYMLKKKYPKLNCLTTSETVTPAKFPTLYLQEKQSELLQDLTNESVNAVNSTIYIRVWTNTTQTDCKAILADAITELKRFRYNIQSLPTATISDKISFGEIIANRKIGAGDDIAK